MNGANPELSPLWLSLRSASLAVLLVAPLGFACATGLRQLRGWQRGLAELAVLSPLVLPPTVVGFILLQLLGRYGPMGGLLGHVGFEIVFSWQATVLSSAVAAFPLMVRSALASLEQIDGALPQVARSLGASEGRILRQIVLPLAMPGLVAGVSLSFARALGEFGTTLMLAGNIPGQTQTLPLAIFAAVDAGETGLAWFWTLLVLLLNGCCLLVMQLFETRANRRPPGRNQLWGVGRRLGRVAWTLRRRARPLASQDTSSMNQGGPASPFFLKVDLNHQLGPFALQLAFSSSSRRLGILGASGAGKSQLLRCLAGLETPQWGRIELNGRVLFDSESKINVPLQRRRIGLVVQHYALFPHLNVAENVGFSLSRLPPEQRQERVRHQLERVGLRELGHRYPSQLSGGQQQRIALARALASEPDLLLLDEPFSAQDTYRRRHLQQQLADLLQDCQVPALLVTHDLEEAYRLSDDLLVINQGKLLAHGPKHEVFDQPQDLVVAQLSGCKNFSRVRPLSPTTLWAMDWQLEIHQPEGVDAEISHVGIRANHLKLVAIDQIQQPLTSNQWLCQLIKASEGPFQVSAYVVPNDSPGPNQQPIQVEVRRTEWQQLCDRRQPWVLQLPVKQLMLLHCSAGNAQQSSLL
jgi:molybdate transport system permease protein